MFKSALFWGILLIVFGVLLGLQAAGFITQSIWGYFWGVFLVFLGVWVIWGMTRKSGFDEGEHVRAGLSLILALVPCKFLVGPPQTSSWKVSLAQRWK
jgi:hypothetical protein